MERSLVAPQGPRHPAHYLPDRRALALAQDVDRGIPSRHEPRNERAPGGLHVNAAMERLNAALDGRYTIERELGQGGMATVYLALDLSRLIELSAACHFAPSATTANHAGLERLFAPPDRVRMFDRACQSWTRYPPACPTYFSSSSRPRSAPPTPSSAS